VWEGRGREASPYPDFARAHAAVEAARGGELGKVSR